ncbi:MAG: cell envelope integrity protein CreD [Woeseiaceae bacterium]
MRIPGNVDSRSASIKVIVIALLTLVLLIPLGMIRNIVVDRQNNASAAALNIRQSWGGEQIITGPVLKLPYELENTTVHGLSYVDERCVYLLADELMINADVETEIRYRGIHKVPVFASIITIRGRIDFTALKSLGISPEQVRWSGAELFVGVSDPMALGKIPVVMANSNEVSFVAGGKGVDGLASELVAPLGEAFEGSEPMASLILDISLAVNGSGSLQFLPLAENAELSMSSNWASPSFTGRQLPKAREIRDDGFEASWHSTRIGRKLPAAWIGNDHARVTAGQGAFGARFIETVGLYHLIERSTKYAVLIIGLTFVAYFLMEVVANLKLHPLQYLLVGLANTLFFLLLLSLSEHMGFDAAYVLSAGASTTLIAGYSAAILTSRTRASLMIGVLAALYVFLYMTLKAQSVALLAGSIGLWVALAVVMYLTRGINWYANDVNNSGDEPIGDQKQATVV